LGGWRRAEGRGGGDEAGWGSQIGTWTCKVEHWWKTIRAKMANSYSMWLEVWTLSISSNLQWRLHSIIGEGKSRMEQAFWVDEESSGWKWGHKTKSLWNASLEPVWSREACLPGICSNLRRALGFLVDITESAWANWI
jgi:hypothetical protein